jgi:hypothetical protein
LREGWVLGGIEGEWRQCLQLHWFRFTDTELQALAAQLGLEGFAPNNPNAQRALPLHWATLLWTNPTDPVDLAERDRLLAITLLMPKDNRKVFDSDGNPLADLHEILVRKSNPAEPALIEALHDANALPFDPFQRKNVWQPTLYTAGF